MTDQKLKSALAKMLPDKIHYLDGFKWKNDYGTPLTIDVTDREWLHVCWLVEQRLDPSTCEAGLHEYHCVLAGLITATIEFRFAISATWQQRATALIRVTGIEI